MSRTVSLAQLEARVALRRSARPVQCKTGLGASRARKCKVVHRVRSMTAACTEGRIRYYAEWECGDTSGDAVIVADPATFDRFCKRCESLTQAPLTYFCYSADGRLLYIGSCVLWESREALHRKQTPWWPEVARVDKFPYPDLPAARRAEKAAIRADAPLYNKQHNVKRFRHNGHEYVPIAEAA